MNPYTATREQFTQQFLDHKIQPQAKATKNYAHLHKTLLHLLDLLAHHPAMVPNLQQTYMTPAASKNKVYFMWDFTGRTVGQLLALKPSEPRSQAQAMTEVLGRSTFGSVLITDSQDKLDMMVGGPKKKEFEFGPEIIKAAEAVTRDPDEDAEWEDVEEGVEEDDDA